MIEGICLYVRVLVQSYGTLYLMFTLNVFNRTHCFLKKGLSSQTKRWFYNTIGENHSYFHYIAFTLFFKPIAVTKKKYIFLSRSMLYVNNFDYFFFKCYVKPFSVTCYMEKKTDVVQKNGLLVS